MKRLVADPLSSAGVVLLALLLVVGTLGPMGIFGQPSTIVGAAIQPPSFAHLFGTDNLGRSILARTVAGIQQSILLATAAVLIAVLIGTLLGMIAGYFRGLADELIARLADALFSFPAIVFAILISALFRPGAESAIAAVVLVTLPAVIRVVRAETLIVAGRDYITQARIAGAGAAHVLAVHIAPNILGAVIVQAAYSISFGMIIESGISFLGLGVQPPGASLGSLLFEGRLYLPIAPWLVLIPGVVLALTILAINLVGDALKLRFAGGTP
jgi:peptide/nickel transport system permease protein